MNVCLLVMTDGRDTVHEAIDSARRNLHARVAGKVIHDDSGDPERRAQLAARYPDFEVIGGERSGFGGAIRRAWAHIEQLPVEWVFHLEDDFTFERPVSVPDMIEVLEPRPHIQQMALRRQPWNPAEQAVGGIIEQHPAEYTERSDGRHRWLEHRRFFTTNPSLYRRSLCRRGWPGGAHSEGRFSLALFAQDPSWCSAYWGERDSAPWVYHIGVHRAGTGY